MDAIIRREKRDKRRLLNAARTIESDDMDDDADDDMDDDDDDEDDDDE
ncbi:MAG: hypothetical protein KAJ19_20700 [Gammaproteobacteria bacterium]|nr:hypothetical protein [Gammaproteobacteria bacterium]